MKQKHLHYHKFVLYLLCLIIITQSALAIGSTFAIVQGTASSQTVSFEIYVNGTFIGLSPEIETNNGLFALTVTIPEEYTSVDLKPVLNGQVQENQFMVNSGDVVEISLSEEVMEPQLLASQDVSGGAATKRNDDLLRGDIEEYEDEFETVPIPEISEEKPVTGYEFNTIDLTPKRIELPATVESDIWRKFILNPYTISTVLVAYLLVLTLYIRKYRGKRTN